MGVLWSLLHLITLSIDFVTLSIDCSSLSLSHNHNLKVVRDIEDIF